MPCLSFPVLSDVPVFVFLYVRLLARLNLLHPFLKCFFSRAICPSVCASPPPLSFPFFVDFLAVLSVRHRLSCPSDSI
jgi:hypothetical protein